MQGGKLILETFDTNNAKFTIYTRWPKGALPWEPLIAYNIKTEKMEEVKPPYTYIDENGSTWNVLDKPITGIKIGSF
jgi:hypothetical protein